MQQRIQITSKVLWTYINATISNSWSGRIDDRIWIFSYLDIHVAIVSFEKCVVDRFVLLDEIILQVECLTFGHHRHEINFGCLGKHVLLPHRSGRKVLWHALFQILCFSDIQNFIFLSVEKIDSWQVWNSW